MLYSPTLSGIQSDGAHSLRLRQDSRKLSALRYKEGAWDDAHVAH